MTKTLTFGVMCILCAVALACSKTEIEKNPQPIVWGGITFKPATIERSPDKTVYNQMTFSGYGKKGTIERVTVSQNETQIDNIDSDFYAAKKLILKGVSGNYREALEFVMSGDFQEAYQNQSRVELPKFNISSYEGVGEKWIEGNRQLAIESESAHNVSFYGAEDCKATNLELTEANIPSMQIGSLSAVKIALPEDFYEHPENITLDKVQAKDIVVLPYKLAVKIVDIDYKDYKLKFAVEQASCPGEALKELGIAEAPAMLEGSMQGKGEISGQKLTAGVSLNLVNLLDATADIAGRLDTDEPEKLSFTLKDVGILKYITNEQKGLLALLALGVPNGQMALMSFLGKPGQTLYGNITFPYGVPDFEFSVK